MKIDYSKRVKKFMLQLDHESNRRSLLQAFGIDNNISFPDYSIDEMPELKGQGYDLDLQIAIVLIDPRYISKIDPARIRNKEDLKDLIKTAVGATKDIFYRQYELREYSKEEREAREKFVEQVKECVEQATANYEAHCQMTASLDSLVESGEEE